MKDNKGNVIEVTLFESYLSKYLIEHPEYFVDVYKKIFGFIRHMEQLNKNNPMFERTMFCLFSSLKDEHTHEHLDDLIGRFDLIAVNSFIKLFCDSILNDRDYAFQFPNVEQRNNNALSNLGFFKEKPPSPEAKRRHSQILAQIRVPALFEPEARGVSEIDKPKQLETCKLGITTRVNTPDDLRCYFAKKYQPSQFFYTPERESNVGKWFTRHNLPIISGTSGSICDDLALALAFLNLSPEELRLLILGRAAMLVAKGHHSFFESMIVLNETGFKLQSQKTLFEFYEQMIPQQIIDSDSYQQFKDSEQGMVLLQGIQDDLADELECEHLLSLNIR